MCLQYHVLCMCECVVCWEGGVCVYNVESVCTCVGGWCVCVCVCVCVDSVCTCVGGEEVVCVCVCAGLLGRKS